MAEKIIHKALSKLIRKPCLRRKSGIVLNNSSNVISKDYLVKGKEKLEINSPGQAGASQPS